MLVRKVINRTARRAAFTLMEMMVVVGIIVVLGGVAIVSYQNFSERGYEGKATRDIAEIDLAIKVYYDDNHVFPATLDVLCSADQFGKVYLKQEALKDPWGQDYIYGQAGTNNQARGAIFKPDVSCDRVNYIICNWAQGKVPKGG